MCMRRGSVSHPQGLEGVAGLAGLGGQLQAVALQAEQFLGAKAARLEHLQDAAHRRQPQDALKKG